MLLHSSASNLVKHLGSGSHVGTETGPSDIINATMHNLKLAYNETVRFFYGFFQTRIVHFYLQKNCSVEELRLKLETQVEVFSQESLRIHAQLDAFHIEQMT